MDEMINLARELHSAIYRYQNDEENNLTVQGWLADADDLLEALLTAKDDMDNGPKDS